MKSGGMSRPIDELGRVVIPKEMRTALGINVKEPLEVFLDGEKIILKKKEVKCALCASKKDLATIGDKVICKECIDKIKKL